jgi:hypothetical protein
MAKRMVQTIVGPEACLVALCMRSPTAFFSIKRPMCFCSSCSNFRVPFCNKLVQHHASNNTTTTTTTVATTVTFRNTCSTPAPQPSSPQVSPASPLSFSYGSRICYVATSERVALSDELRQLYAVRDRIVRDVRMCVFICMFCTGTVVVRQSRQPFPPALRDTRVPS